MFCTLFYYVGLVTVVYLLALLVKFGLRQFHGTPKSNPIFKELKAGSGAWAVITGASDGIGKAYSEELAALGLNVVLVSRTRSKLDAVAADIKSKYSVEAEVVSVDFKAATDDTFSDIQAALAGKNVTVLVNNVGINYEHPLKMLEAEYEQDRDIVNVNVLVGVRMARIVLPSMIENGAGLVINLSSFAGRLPTPMLGIYSGTKAFTDFWSKALDAEYANKGIRFMSITPGLVVSNMSKVRKASLMVSTPNYIARRTLARAGKDVELSPYYVHAIIVRVLESLPVRTCTNILFGQNMNTYKRAMRKKGL